MENQHFQESLDELIGGLPVTLVVNRLVLTLKAVIDATGKPGEMAFLSALGDLEQEEE